MPPTEIRVYLSCPVCRAAFLQAIIRPDTWWGAGAMAETAAKQTHCRRCHTRPPMVVEGIPVEDGVDVG